MARYVASEISAEARCLDEVNVVERCRKCHHLPCNKNHCGYVEAVPVDGLSGVSAGWTTFKSSPVPQKDYVQAV